MDDLAPHSSPDPLGVFHAPKADRGWPPPQPPTGSPVSAEASTFPVTGDVPEPTASAEHGSPPRPRRRGTPARPSGKPMGRYAAEPVVTALGRHSRRPRRTPSPSPDSFRLPLCRGRHRNKLGRIQPGPTGRCAFWPGGTQVYMPPATTPATASAQPTALLPAANYHGYPQAQHAAPQLPSQPGNPRPGNQQPTQQAHNAAQPAQPWGATPQPSPPAQTNRHYGGPWTARLAATSAAPSMEANVAASTQATGQQQDTHNRAEASYRPTHLFWPPQATTQPAILQHPDTQPHGADDRTTCNPTTGTDSSSQQETYVPPAATTQASQAAADNQATAAKAKDDDTPTTLTPPLATGAIGHHGKAAAAALGDEASSAPIPPHTPLAARGNPQQDMAHKGSATKP